MNAWTPLLLAGAAASAGLWPASASQCMARSAAAATPVVELYTSEGCSSCPPADAWLATLEARRDVVALAFHVDYWDRLGWKDRFADPAYTQRQAALRRTSGTRFVYTPQVVLNGVDWRDWPRGRIATGGPAPVEIELARDADVVQARLTPQPGASGRYRGYWAAVEDGHASAVRAGENAGATLHHERVVRAYAPIEPWPAAMPQSLRFVSPATGEGGRLRSVVLVVEDADSGRPLQALALGC